MQVELESKSVYGAYHFSPVMGNVKKWACSCSMRNEMREALIHIIRSNVCVPESLAEQNEGSSAIMVQSWFRQHLMWLSYDLLQHLRYI